MSKFNAYLNRVVVGLTVLTGLATAVAVPLANLDTSSTIGVVSGAGVVMAAALKFLSGWQAHEARVADTAHPDSTRTGELEGVNDPFNNPNKAGQEKIA